MIKVLSLFDGISCGMVALERAGIGVEQYVAYEIDKCAIKISEKNYPQIKHCGDVTTADFTKYKGFDLLIGGSPCQDLCSMGSRKGLEGDKSKLFYEYLRALHEVHPKYFLLENNASMTAENRNKISQLIGVEPILIDSAYFSAQRRKRLYWTNIPISPWSEKNIFICDIMQNPAEKSEFEITEKVKKYCKIGGEYDNRKIQKNIRNKIKFPFEKSNTLGTCCGVPSNNTGLIIKQEHKFYNLTPIEAERLQTLPDNYTAGISNTQRYKCIGNGWTVDVIAHILSGLKAVK